MFFAHGTESLVSLKKKFSSGQYRFVLYDPKKDEEKEVTDFSDIILHILEDKGYEIGYDYSSDKIAEIRENLKKEPITNINYSWKYRDLEVIIKTNEDGEVLTPEIVCWQEDSSHNRTCYTVALWDKTSEGWEMRVIGSRLFDIFEDDYNLELEKVWKGIEGCQRVLDALYEVTRRI